MVKNDSLIKFCFSNQNDYDNFEHKLIDALININISTRKKLLICCTEIVQNNNIHNKYKLAKLTIEKTDGNFNISFIQHNYPDDFKKLKSKIEFINSLSLLDLKELKYSNIIDDNNIKFGAGNGLIECRIKSNNLILISGNKNENNNIETRIIITISHENTN